MYKLTYDVPNLDILLGYKVAANPLLVAELETAREAGQLALLPEVRQRLPVV